MTSELTVQTKPLSTSHALEREIALTLGHIHKAYDLARTLEADWNFPMEVMQAMTSIGHARMHMTFAQSHIKRERRSSGLPDPSYQEETH